LGIMGKIIARAVCHHACLEGGGDIVPSPWVTATYAASLGPASPNLAPAESAQKTAEGGAQEGARPSVQDRAAESGEESTHA